MQLNRGNGATTPRPYIVDRVAEQLLWSQSAKLDTVQAYRAYLQNYPQGSFVRDARNAIEAIRSEPNLAARLNEESLSLTRNQRREIQRDLTLLDFGTRSIDGVFGGGTRSAIAKWQGKNGFTATTFTTANQIRRISDQADRRGAALEAEAASEREAEIRRYRVYWNQTGANGTEAGLRNYLGRYPDGFFANAARASLARIEQTNLEQAAVQDRNAWRAVRNRDTLGTYQAYLRDYPNGAFRQQALARIREIQAAQSAAQVRDRAIASEAALRLNAITMRLVQNKLQQLGFEVGRNDGRFDEQTRRAICQFQQSRNLEITGYLNQQSAVQLLKNRN